MGIASRSTGLIGSGAIVCKDWVFLREIGEAIVAAILTKNCQLISDLMYVRIDLGCNEKKDTRS